MRQAVVAAAAAWTCLAGTPLAAQDALTVEQVLASVDRAFPLLDAARQDQEAAAGEALSARGAFDLRLQGSADVFRGEVYDNETAAVSLYQPLTVAGAYHSPLMAGAIFVLISVFSVVFLRESLDAARIGGMVCILAGIVLLSRGV